MATDVGERFAAVLRRSRVAAGLTQRDLAERTGVAERTISDLERGVANVPRRSTVDLLCAGLGVDAAGCERLRRSARTGGAVGRPRKPPPAEAPIDETGTGPAVGDGTWLGRPRGEEWAPLLGRKADLDRLAGAVAAGGLVTLVGPGGVGKSRLALSAAVQARADGRAVRAVALGAIEDAAAVLPAIAAAWGVPANAATPAGIAAALRAVPSPLLLLDDADRVAAAAPALADLAAAMPAATVLVTARAPLAAPGERAIDLPPLALPRRDPLGGWEDPAALAANPAVALFRQRAAQAGAGADDGSPEEVAAVVVRVGGLPLAIELLAAQSATFSPGAMLALLDRAGLPLLERPRSASDRQATMRAAVAWSVDVLPAAARRLFEVVGAFAGGFSPDALEAVLIAVGDSALGAALPTLVRARLVHQVAGTGGAGAPVRLAMLEPVRWVAAARLDRSWNAASVRRAHAEWYAGWARRTGDAVTTPALREALAAEAADRANAIAAVRWSLATDESEPGAAIAAALFRTWEAAAVVVPLRGEIDALADRATAIPDPNDRRLVCYAAAYLGVQVGDPAAVHRYAARLRAMTDDPAARGLALLVESLLPAADPAALEPGLREAADALTAAGHPYAWMPRLRIGAEVSLAGRHAEGLRLLEEVLAERERAGDEFDLPPALWQMGRTLTDMGRLQDARATYRRMALLCRRYGFAAAMVQALHGFADAACRTRDPSAAERGVVLAGAVLAFRERAGMPIGAVWAARTDDALAAAAALLGRDRVAALLDQGETTGFAEAVALLLDEDGDPLG